MYIELIFPLLEGCDASILHFLEPISLDFNNLIVFSFYLCEKGQGWWDWDLVLVTV